MVTVINNFTTTMVQKNLVPNHFVPVVPQSCKTKETETPWIASPWGVWRSVCSGSVRQETMSWTWRGYWARRIACWLHACCWQVSEQPFLLPCTIQRRMLISSQWHFSSDPKTIQNARLIAPLWNQCNYVWGNHAQIYIYCIANFNVVLKVWILTQSKC